MMVFRCKQCGREYAKLPLTCFCGNENPAFWDVTDPEKDEAAALEERRIKEEREKAEFEKAERERAAREQAERERAAREQAERERAAREQAERERAAREQAERERAAWEQAERERAAREQAERERAAWEQAERERAKQSRKTKKKKKKEKEEEEKKSKLPLIPVLLLVLLLAGAGIGFLLKNGATSSPKSTEKPDVTDEAAPTEGELTEQTPTEAPAAPVLMADPIPEAYRSGSDSLMIAADMSVFGNASYCRADIEEITFTNDVSRIPAEGAWDVSAAKDGSVTAWVENDESLFIAASGPIRAESCKELFAFYYYVQEIDFGGIFDVSKATDLTGMFEECFYLKALDLSALDTSRATSMSKMFFNCNKLKTLDLSGAFSTVRVRDFRLMFYKCEGLDSLDLSGFDTSSAETMRGMFLSCRMDALDLSGFNTANVTDMSRMFCSCTGLTSLDLSSFDTSNVTDMSFMFNGCVSLSSVNVLSFNTSRVTTMEGMFLGCVRLEEADISSFSDASLENVKDMFSADGRTRVVKTKIIYVKSKFNPENVPIHDNWNGMFDGLG